MNARELRPLFKQLLPSLPGFVAHKRLLLKAPMNGMLRAINFDPSAFDKETIYIEPFVMPLCTPKDHISLLLGERLRNPTGGEMWSANVPNLVTDLSEAIQRQGLPIVNAGETLRGFRGLVKGAWTNPHVPKYLAFVLARAGERDEAIALIDDYLPTLDLDVHWEKEIHDLSVHLRDLLKTDPEAADRQLREWEDFTIQKLKLEAFR